MSREFRGCRFAQPPANSRQPSGLQRIGIFAFVYNDERTAWMRNRGTPRHRSAARITGVPTRRVGTRKPGSSPVLIGVEGLRGGAKGYWGKFHGAKTNHREALTKRWV